MYRLRYTDTWRKRIIENKGEWIYDSSLVCSDDIISDFNDFSCTTNSCGKILKHEFILLRDYPIVIYPGQNRTMECAPEKAHFINEWDGTIVSESFSSVACLQYTMQKTERYTLMN